MSSKRQSGRKTTTKSETPSQGWRPSLIPSHKVKAPSSTLQRWTLLMELTYTDENHGTQIIGLWVNTKSGMIMLCSSIEPQDLYTNVSIPMPLQSFGMECLGINKRWTHCGKWDLVSQTSPLFGIKVKLGKQLRPIPPSAPAMSRFLWQEKGSPNSPGQEEEMSSPSPVFKRKTTQRKSRSISSKKSSE